jgi:hypothetical protein
LSRIARALTLTATLIFYAMREAMRLVALGAVLLLSACASTYAANPNDPVDMAAELGNRGRQYVGMGEVCDTAAGGAHRAAIVHAVQSEQQRLGVLAGLVDRAYRGHASNELAAHMSQEMSAHGVTAPAFCAEVVQQAQAEISQRGMHILTLSGEVDALGMARDITRPLYADTPSFDPADGYRAWVD